MEGDGTLRYLRVDGGTPGCGLREPTIGRYLEQEEVEALPLSVELVTALTRWAERYQEHVLWYYGAETEATAELDRQGCLLCLKLREELPEVKVDYYSEALCKWVPFPERCCD